MMATWRQHDQLETARIDASCALSNFISLARQFGLGGEITDQAMERAKELNNTMRLIQGRAFDMARDEGGAHP